MCTNSLFGFCLDFLEMLMKKGLMSSHRVALRSAKSHFVHLTPIEAIINDHPQVTSHSLKVGSMLAHRLRRCPNIETTMGECLVYAGYFSETNGVLSKNESVILLGALCTLWQYSCRRKSECVIRH